MEAIQDRPQTLFTVLTCRQLAGMWLPAKSSIQNAFYKGHFLTSFLSQCTGDVARAEMTLENPVSGVLTNLGTKALSRWLVNMCPFSPHASVLKPFLEHSPSTILC